MRKKILLIFSISCAILFFIALVFNFIICPKKYKNFVVAYAHEYELDVALVYAIIKVESDFDKKAVSISDALGLMQILPSTAKWIADEIGVEYSRENMFNEDTNVRFGCFYLRYLFDKFKDKDIVICAYNAGEGKVLDWVENGSLVSSEIDYPETKKYLEKVNKYYNLYSNNLINE